MRNKVAESIFEPQYIVAKWKLGKSGIFHKADDFDFLMSRGDPYYQFYKNAPIACKFQHFLNCDKSALIAKFPGLRQKCVNHWITEQMSQNKGEQMSQNRG